MSRNSASASENKAERLALAILQGEHQLAPITMACFAWNYGEDRNAHSPIDLG